MSAEETAVEAMEATDYGEEPVAETTETVQEADGTATTVHTALQQDGTKEQTVTEITAEPAAEAVVETQQTTTEHPDGSVEEVVKTTIVNGDAAAADEAADQAAEMIEAEATDTAQAAAHTAEAADGIEPAAVGEASAAQDTAVNGAAEATPGGQAGTDAEPEDPTELPPHGCEVFVGGVPRTATEEMLKEFAERAGPIFSCSLLKDPGNPGTNRGYGFIKYKEKDVADKAMETLHQQSLSQFPENKLRVSSSQSKNKIYVGNIPRAFSQEQIESAIKPHVVGLTATEVLQSKDFPGQNRGFCFLEFYNHACAQKAKTALDTGSFKMGDRVLTISYAEPRRDDTQPQQKEVKACYVGHLPDDVDDTKLIEAFAPIGEVIKVVLPGGKDGRKYRDYGFVHFNERSQALKAVEDYGSGTFQPKIGEASLEVKMAKPQIQQDKAGFGDMGRGGGFGGQGARGRGGRGFGGRGDYGGGYGGGYDSYGSMGGYDDGSGYGAAGAADYSGYAGYGGYGGYASAGYGAQAPVGMVPMMLPNGQVGYVLSGGAGAGGMATGGGYGTGAAAGGPVRSSSGGGRRGGGGGYGGSPGYGGGGRGRGGSRGGGSGGYGRGAGAAGGQRYRPY